MSNSSILVFAPAWWTAAAAVVVATSLSAAQAATATEGNRTLPALLQAHSYSSTDLRRLAGNFLTVSAIVNGERAEFLVDTGSTNTVIDRRLERRLGLSVRPSGKFVRGTLGSSRERYGRARVDRMSVGNFQLTRVPVIVFELSPTHGATAKQNIRVDGLFGARQMRLNAAVIDFHWQAIFMSRLPRRRELSDEIAAALGKRGFRRIPIRITSTARFAVDAAVNGVATTLLIDSGAYVTCLDEALASRAGLEASRNALRMTAVGQREAEFRLAKPRSLNIGDVRINNAELLVTKMTADTGATYRGERTEGGVLGAEYLALKSAIIDCGGMALYLRN